MKRAKIPDQTTFLFRCWVAPSTRLVIKLCTSIFTFADDFFSCSISPKMPNKKISPKFREREGENFQDHITYRRCLEKTSLCLSMHFSLCCINGLIESKHITLKSPNNTLLVMKSNYTQKSFYYWCICLLSTHSCNKMITQNSTHRRFFSWRRQYSACH